MLGGHPYREAHGPTAPPPTTRPERDWEALGLSGFLVAVSAAAVVWGLVGRGGFDAQADFAFAMLLVGLWWLALSVRDLWRAALSAR
jgi:hypothetical protein